MSNHSPIPSPPPELVEQRWNTPQVGGDFAQEFAAFFARWGADQELKACCKWMRSAPFGLSLNTSSNQLRAARRPEPLCLKKQALAALEVIPKLVGFESERDAIYRALEALDD